MSVLGRIAVVISIFALSRCTPPPEPPDTREAGEAAIRAAVKEWSAAAEAKDADKFVSFYTDDGTLMPDTRGRQELLGSFSGIMQDPNFALSLRTDDVVVARSGDLAYETGSYTLTMSGPDGSPAPTNGRYVVVWKKTSDGSWKAAVDAPISDPPAAQ